MSLSISSVKSYAGADAVSFLSGEKPSRTKSAADNGSENPISRKGETMNLVKATFLGGMALGARLLWELMDGDFLFEHAGRKASDIVDKNRSELKGAKRELYKIGAAFGLIIAGISGFAILYTIFNAPKIAYNGKVNTFKKGKEMDVYIKANEVEKNIYTELAQKAKMADEDEQDRLKEQYMQMKMAKNQVPDFVK